MSFRGAQDDKYKLIVPGILPIDPRTGEIVHYSGGNIDGSAVRQTIQCLDNLETILRVPEYTLGSVFKVVVYLDSDLQEKVITEVISNLKKRLPNCNFTFAPGNIPRVVHGPKIFVQIDPVEVWNGIF
ncbi:MAG: hypothetical protein WCG25_08285 [bacterium]